MLVRFTQQLNLLQQQQQQYQEQLASIEQMLRSQQLHGVEITRADLFDFRRHQAILLFQREQIRLDALLLDEQIKSVEEELQQCRQRLLFLKRREMKFSQWLQTMRTTWLQEQESTSENDNQDNVPWRFQFP